jgi:Domain of unknown function (DUF4424)
MKTASIVFLAAALAGTAALANDTSAELTTGGLVFTRNDDVEMRAEDLFISAKEIRVRYRFFNKSERDVTVHVAFPMPDVTVEHINQIMSLPTGDPVNLLGFVTHVDGKPVTTQVEQKVTAKGADHTALLRDLGVPLAPHLESTNEALNRLPAGKRDELVRLGLAEVEEFDQGRGPVKELAARWDLKTTFYWEQVFPAGKEIVIEHRYKPSVGESVMTALGISSESKEPWHADYIRKYCIEPTTLAAIERARRAAPDGNTPYSEERIDYILKTGANWSGPIGDFRVVIDKGEASALVSFCGDGIKKIGPTKFEMRKTNFTPDGNLSVLILKRLRGQ